MSEWPFSEIESYTVEQDDGWVDWQDAEPHAFIITEYDETYGECLMIYYSRYCGA